MACRADDLALSKLDLEPSTAVIILQSVFNWSLKAQLGTEWGPEAVQQRHSISHHCPFPKEAYGLWSKWLKLLCFLQKLEQNYHTYIYVYDCWKVVLKSLWSSLPHLAALSNNWRCSTARGSLNMLFFSLKCHFVIILLSSNGKLRWNVFQKETELKCTGNQDNAHSGCRWKLLDKHDVSLFQDFPWISLGTFSDWEKIPRGRGCF